MSKIQFTTIVTFPNVRNSFLSDGKCVLQSLINTSLQEKMIIYSTSSYSFPVNWEIHKSVFTTIKS